LRSALRRDPDEVISCDWDADGMLHGHTYRPMVHELLGED